MDATAEQEQRRLNFTAWVRSTGVTSRQIDEATQTNMGGHYTTAASQPAIMTREHLEACRHLFGQVPAWVEREADIRSVESRNMAAREVLNSREGVKLVYAPGEQCDHTSTTIKITAPATDAAREWAGWGTALKPAWEPIIMARKPLVGTVAANLLLHGTGALNIDGARVGAEMMPRTQSDGTIRSQNRAMAAPNTGRVNLEPIQGRWPANLMHDGSPEVVAGFPTTTSGGLTGGSSYATHDLGFHGGGKGAMVGTHGDRGSASRFFYCAKASRADRDEGCDHLPGYQGHEVVERKEGSAGLNSPRAGAGRTITSVRELGGAQHTANVQLAKNHHPTVKPTELMRYLIRLITPPGGTVLDPFMGSGSTGKAAMLEGATFRGCDLDPAYLTIAEARILFGLQLQAEEAAEAYESTRQLSLFGDL